MQEKLDKAKEDVMAANMALTWFRDHCLLTEDE